LTAPLKYVRRRRFRRPRFDRPIEAVHEEVRRLLAADAEAVQSSNELVDISEMQRFREEEEGYGRRREDSYFGRASTAAYQEEEEVEMESVMMGDETMQGDEEEEEFDLFDELNAALAKSDPADPLPPPTP